MIVGCSTFGKLKNNFDFNKYTNIEVIITHLHNDHAGSLSQFILYIWFVYHKKVTVFCECEKIKEYLDITGTTREAYELKGNTDFLQFIKTEHAKELDAYGFKLNINGKIIIYTGDTKTLEPFLPYLTDCNEFYVDVSKSGGVHLKFEDIFETLRKIKNNHTNVFLMHLDDKKYIANLNHNEFFLD